MQGPSVPCRGGQYVGEGRANPSNLEGHTERIILPKQSTLAAVSRRGVVQLSPHHASGLCAPSGGQAIHDEQSSSAHTGRGCGAERGRLEAGTSIPDLQAEGIWPCPNCHVHLVVRSAGILGRTPDPLYGAWTPDPGEKRAGAR